MPCPALQGGDIALPCPRPLGPPPLSHPRFPPNWRWRKAQGGMGRTHLPSGNGQGSPPKGEWAGLTSQGGMGRAHLPRGNGKGSPSKVLLLLPCELQQATNDRCLVADNGLQVKSAAPIPARSPSRRAPAATAATATDRWSRRQRARSRQAPRAQWLLPLLPGLAGRTAGCTASRGCMAPLHLHGLSATAPAAGTTPPWAPLVPCCCHTLSAGATPPLAGLSHRLAPGSAPP